MPASSYNTSPFNIGTMAMRGVLNYSIGAWNDMQPPVVGNVTNVVANGTTATVSLTALSGTVPPIVGAFVSIQNVPTSAGSPATTVFNVSRQQVTAVSGFNTGDNSTGTVSFALADTVASTPEQGQIIIDVPETRIAISAAPYTGRSFAIPETSLGRSSGDSLSWSFFPASTDIIASIEVDLQGANRDLDGDYTTFDKSTNIAGETRTINLSNLNCAFVRCKVVSLSSTGSIHAVSYFKV